MSLQSIVNSGVNQVSKVLGYAENAKKALNQQIKPDKPANNSKGGLATTSTNSNAIDRSPNAAYSINFFSQLYNGESIAVTAYLPERVNMSVTSEYGTPFMNLAPANLMGEVGGGALAGIMGTTGMIQAMSIKVWQSSQGLTLQVPLVFMSDTDPKENLINIMNLYKLSVPSSPGGPFGLLRAPGPNYAGLDKLKKIGASLGRELGDLVTGQEQNNFTQDVVNVLKEGIQNQISVTIGTYLKFDSVVVDNVDVDFESIISAPQYGGRPWKAEVNVQFSTLMTPSLEDMYNIFMLDNPRARADGNTSQPAT